MSFSSRVERIRSCKSSLVLSSLWHPTPDWVIPSCRCTPYLYFPEVVSPFDWQLCISSLPRSTPRSRWVVHKWAPVDFASANNIMVWHWALRVPPRAKCVSSTVGPAWPVGEQTKLPSHTAGGEEGTFSNLQTQLLNIHQSPSPSLQIPALHPLSHQMYYSKTVFPLLNTINKWWHLVTVFVCWINNRSRVKYLLVIVERWW